MIFSALAPSIIHIGILVLFMAYDHCANTLNSDTGTTPARYIMK